MRALLLSAVVLCGCGGGTTEEDLISDSDVGAIQSELTVQGTSVPVPGALHLRLTWGYLAGNSKARNWVNWTGGVKVDSGTASLERLVFFDRRDFIVPGSDPTAVSWKSRTLPHFDGVVVRIAPGSPSDLVHVVTPVFSRDFTVAELIGEQRFSVDDAGHEISVSAIPDVGCGGFAYGYQKDSGEGWLGFAGLLTDEHGAPMGVLRFRADAGVVKARLVGRDQQVLAEGTGTLNGEEFALSLGAVGELKGFFRPGSPRGSFQASLVCPAQ